MKPSLPLRASALAVTALALGCGGSASSDLGGPSGPPSGKEPGAEAGASGDATVSNGDPGAGGFGFTPSPTDDGGVVSSVCAAGVYQGQFMTYVGSGGDGGAPGIFSLMWNGTLSIDLAAKKITMTSTMRGGEGLGTTTSTTTLEIADGGALEGGDTMGGAFHANLNGTLDCSPDAGPPYHFTATLSDGTYAQAFFQIPMIGTLTADYQAGGDAGAPSLVGGGILVGGLLMDGGMPFASASGTWSATWVSP
jgi:hypothetical protein